MRVADRFQKHLPLAAPAAALGFPQLHQKLLNRFDRDVLEELEWAEKFYLKGWLERALGAYNELLESYPYSPWCHFRKAQISEELADRRGCASLGRVATRFYATVVEMPEVPAGLVRPALERRTALLLSLGKTCEALSTFRRLVKVFPKDASLRAELKRIADSVKRAEDPPQPCASEVAGGWLDV
ncbi:aspartyl/asparaginyl beta-hydroxylase-like isoform X2 [Lampetra planeri]